MTAEKVGEYINRVYFPEEGCNSNVAMIHQIMYL